MATSFDADMIFLNNLEFSYANTLPVLSLDSLKVDTGEKVFLYGPSGSGKTTLLGILGGVLQADRGTVSVLNQDLTRMSNSARDTFRGNHVGFVFQMFNLIPFLKVRENILLSLNFSRLKKEKTLKRFGSLEKALHHFSESLGIFSILEKKSHEISVGQAQRVAAARALIGSPELIIADEPTSALDAHLRNEFIQLLFQEIHETKSALLFVSHDKSLASLFDREIDLTLINQARKTRPLSS
jgi:putative ABC transport system ATP-binding protein